ncbi:hypothetical protein [Candidatus Nitrososphaera sp. FF02]|uniref:hypothetical protein n=1 Tax=Candidatus Nitrososphaera sp. FF02 TaxID=3398226 RepID=UPI0039E7740F
MSTKRHDVKTSAPRSIAIDFGERTISNQNFSKIVALPKKALINCGIEGRKVRVLLVHDKGEKYLKLAPVTKKRRGIE